MSASDRVQVPGSERQLDPAHTRVGDVDPQAEIDLTVYLRPRAGLAWVDKEAMRAPHSGASPAGRGGPRSTAPARRTSKP